MSQSSARCVCLCMCEREKQTEFEQSSILADSSDVTWMSVCTSHGLEKFSVDALLLSPTDSFLIQSQWLMTYSSVYGNMATVYTSHVVFVSLLLSFSLTLSHTYTFHLTFKSRPLSNASHDAIIVTSWWACHLRLDSNQWDWICRMNYRDFW